LCEKNVYAENLVLFRIFYKRSEVFLEKILSFTLTLRRIEKQTAQVLFLSRLQEIPERSLTKCMSVILANLGFLCNKQKRNLMVQKNIVSFYKIYRANKTAEKNFCLNFALLVYTRDQNRQVVYIVNTNNRLHIIRNYNCRTRNTSTITLKIIFSWLRLKILKLNTFSFIFEKQMAQELNLSHFFLLRTSIFTVNLSRFLHLSQKEFAVSKKFMNFSENKKAQIIHPGFSKNQLKLMTPKETLGDFRRFHTLQETSYTEDFIYFRRLHTHKTILWPQCMKSSDF
jgi:hypothetical protein